MSEKDVVDEQMEEEQDEEEEEDDQGDMDADYVPPGEEESNPGASSGSRTDPITGLLTTPLKSPPAKEYADKLVS